MGNDANLVTLNVHSYNQIKLANMRADMFMDRLLYTARLSSDHQRLEFSSEDVATALEFCYLEAYKKKLAYLKAQRGRQSSREEELKALEEESKAVVGKEDSANG